MFNEVDFNFFKKPIEVLEEEINLVKNKEQYITIKNPNNFDISFKISSCYGFISVESTVLVKANKTTKIPLTINDNTINFEDIILVEENSIIHKIYVKYKKEVENILIGTEYISNLKQLYDMYLIDEQLVKNHFFTLNFKEWLKNNYIDNYNIYNLLLEDTKEDRVLENFFSINNFKKKCEIFFENKKIVVDRKTDSEVINLKLNKTDGYCEDEIEILENVNYVTFEKTKLSNKDFENNKCNVKVIIDFGKVSSFGETIHFVIGNSKIAIEIKSKFGVSISLSKKVLRDGESFFINIKNDMPYKVRITFRNSLNYFKTPDSINIRGNSEENIPVDIAFTKLQKASTAIQRVPYINGEITCNYDLKGSNLKKKKLEYKILLYKVGKYD